jgi:serine/threonine protein kinase
MHQAGVLHRNLNIGNLYITKDGSIKLGSYLFCKLSRPLSDIVPHQRVGAGSAVTAAPELRNCIQPTSMADMWSAGCLIYQLASGKGPANLAQKPLAATVQQVPLRFGEKIRQVLRMTLQRDPGLRVDAHEIFTYLAARTKPPRVHSRGNGPGA